MKKPICPRCGGFIPNNDQPGAYPGALSRVDNETEVCSSCGSQEAMLDYFASQKAGKYVCGSSKATWVRPEAARKLA